MPVPKSVLKDFVGAMPFAKVVKKLESTPFGHRLWPSQTSKNDENFNLRLDKGSTLPDGRHEVIIQANKNAKNKSVRESAQKDSHVIVCKMAIDPKNPDELKMAEDAFDSFAENN